MTNNTEAVIKATTEYDLAVLPELVEKVEEMIDRVYDRCDELIDCQLDGFISETKSTLDRLKRRGE